jgi:hypothetical protein
MRRGSRVPRRSLTRVAPRIARHGFSATNGSPSFCAIWLNRGRYSIAIAAPQERSNVESQPGGVARRRQRMLKGCGVDLAPGPSVHVGPEGLAQRGPGCRQCGLEQVVASVKVAGAPIVLNDH